MIRRVKCKKIRHLAIRESSSGNMKETKKLFWGPKKSNKKKRSLPYLGSDLYLYI